MTSRAKIAFVTGWVCALGALSSPGTFAAAKSTEKVWAEPAEGMALAYFVREARYVGSARTMFLYADDAFLGVVDNDGYTFAQVEPGSHTLWLNWTRVNARYDFEAGQTYYFLVTDGFLDLPADLGREKVLSVKHYCAAEAKEIATADDHIRKRGDKAARRAEKETGEIAGGKGAREAHIARWPTLDLSGYSILVIEDSPVTDPKAAERKDADLLEAASFRLPNLIRADIDAGTFAEVRRGTLDDPAEGALILRVELTQYKPGSRFGRAMLAGAGSARLDFTARIIDGATGKELATFSDERSYGWGGAMGAAGGIESIERNLAYELATWLERCTGAGDGGEEAEPRAARVGSTEPSEEEPAP